MNNSDRIKAFFEEQDRIAVERAAGIDYDDENWTARPNGRRDNPLPADLGIWDAGDDDAPIPPREWLLGNVFCRRMVSSVIASGGGGKTALRVAQCLSLATGKSLTGEHVFQRCRVLLVSLEDDRDELRRRVEAARLHYCIKREELKGWLFLSAPGHKAGKLAVTTQNGAPKASDLADLLRTEIKRLNIDHTCIDPLIKAHSIPENDNNAMDLVTEILADLAVELNCSIDAPHHVSKGTPDPGNADRGRGGSSFKDGARLVYTLAPMSEQEAKLFNINPEDRPFLIRMDRAKVNPAPPSGARWFKLVGVPIGNATELYPAGDEVQTVEPWDTPDLWAEIGVARANEILSLIERGMPNGQRYSGKPQAKSRAAWPVVKSVVASLTEPQAKQVISTWIKNGVLEHRPYLDPVRRTEEDGLFLIDGKRPG